MGKKENHQSVSQTIKNATSSVRQKIHTNAFRTGLLITTVAFVAGFAGGAVGSNAFPDRITSLDNTETQQRIASSQSELISGIAKDVSPSVVSINVESTVKNWFYYNDTVRSSSGTGFVISSDGMIVTNRHVIPDNVSKVSITTAEGKVYDNVDVVARDSRSNMDIAFLKVKGVTDFKPVKLGDSSKMVVGDSVIAIGYALGEFQNTVTSGIISGLGRPIVASDGGSAGETLTNLFQTDAAINPGNSGGPLVNLNGEVIGINTAVAGGAENIGFSIPINDVKPQITSVLETGKLQIPYLGVRYIMLTEGLKEQYNLKRDEGAWLKSSDRSNAVMNDSPADKAGLKEGDIIFKINNEDITLDNPLATALSKYSVGDTLDITFNRDGDERTVQATLEVSPEQ